MAAAIAIVPLGAAGLNLVLGYTGLVVFRPAADFGNGVCTRASPMKKLGVPLAPALPSAGFALACASPRSASPCGGWPWRSSSAPAAAASASMGGRCSWGDAP
jgi:ABC-type branched-subunit amino acid transport system permease subunit